MIARIQIQNISGFLLIAACWSSFAAPAHAAAQAGDGAALYQQSYEEEAAGNVRGALLTMERIGGAERAGYLFELRRAWLLYLGERYDDSIAAYRTAADRAPGAVEPLLGMTLPQLALRRWRDVMATAKRVVRLDPHSELGRTRLAFALYQLGRYEPSRKLYAEVLRDYPSKLDLRAGLAWCLLRLKKGAAAAREFRAVLSAAPRHASAKEGLRGVEGASATAAGSR